MPSYIIKTGGSTESTSYNNSRRVSRSSNGDLHAVYYRFDGSYDQIYYSKSTDKGENWTEIKLTNENYGQYNPSIAIDSNNYIHIIWAGKHSGSPDYYQIRYIKYTTSWQTIENLTAEDYSQYCPSIAVESNNYIHIAWMGCHSESPSFWQIRYRKYTTSWQTIENLTAADEEQNNPSIAIDNNNYIHIVWMGYLTPTPDYYQIRYRKFTTSWQDIENLTSGDYNQYNPSIAVDNNNYIHIVWHGSHPGSAYDQIRYRKYTTSWQDIENLTSGDYTQSYPSISVDSNNYIHIIWMGQYSESPSYYQIRYRKYITSWQDIENLTSASQDQYYPNLIWGNYPIISSIRTNRPKNGYAFIWTDDTTIKFYKSIDLAWDKRKIEFPNVKMFMFPKDIKTDMLRMIKYMEL